MKLAGEDSLSKPQNIDTLHVMPGMTCNFTCSHCVNDSGPSNRTKIKSDEISQVVSAIDQMKPRNLIFTGGEPTLYVSQINQIIDRSSHKSFRVLLTTNGWYASSPEKIRKTLGRFSKLNSVQLSHDVFHRAGEDTGHIKKLKQYCTEKRLDFNVSICISNPLDLLKAKTIVREYPDVSFTFQKVEASGRAQQNNLSFQYPEFDQSSLEKKCPNLEQISFISGKGFSSCCSNLAFNHNPPKDMFGDSLQTYLDSEFYKNIKTKTLAQLAKENNVDVTNLSADFSSVCRLCELVHQNAQK